MDIFISKRLHRIAQLVDNNASVLDVGSDHGLLVEYLLRKGIAKHCIASDISEGSLNKIRYKDSRLDLRVGDGLSVISSLDDKIDTIVIAGMGGLTICDILDGDTLQATLIVSPQSHCDKVRKKLLSIGYTITTDFMVLDKKFYTIIKAKPYCSQQILDDNQLLYGVWFKEDKVLAHYIKLKIDKLKQENQNDCVVDKIKKLTNVLYSQHLKYKTIK